VIRRLLGEAADRLGPGGFLIFEAGWDQKEGIAAMVSITKNWRSYAVLNDLAGHPRVHRLERA
jgi:methylase of polypeptide subunit release factors